MRFGHWFGGVCMGHFADAADGLIGEVFDGVRAEGGTLRHQQPKGAFVPFWFCCFAVFPSFGSCVAVLVLFVPSTTPRSRAVVVLIAALLRLNLLFVFFFCRRDRFSSFRCVPADRAVLSSRLVLVVLCVPNENLRELI